MPGPDTSENPHAGGNAVVLDIGGDVGALVVRMPASMTGVEVQLERLGHEHTPSHGRGHGHEHSHGTELEHGSVHHPHKAVVDRPLPDGSRVPSLVFESVTAGDYRLRVLPAGPCGPEVAVSGGTVTEVVWGTPASSLPED